MRITLAQINPTIADFRGNLEKIHNILKEVESDKPDLIIFSELILSGYPPQDLLERQSFRLQCEESQHALLEISNEFPSYGILFGNIRKTGMATGKGLFNSAILIEKGEIIFIQDKSLLPTYDVFDEGRYFDPTEAIDIFNYKGECLGITICEDAWNDPQLFPDRVYRVNPVDILSQKGATLFLNISASPFGIGKDPIRHHLLRHHVQKTARPFFLVNQVGANDELISDGRSMALDSQGRLIAAFPAFKEHVQTIDLQRPPVPISYAPQEETASIHDALVLGIRDYMNKCGFNKAVLGLSGGIDSAVTCCLAAEALEPENVLAVSMPSAYSSQGSIDDAKILAENLGIQFSIIPISRLVASYEEDLAPHFTGLPTDATEENVQARIRGNILMAFSNKHGHMTLSSGNKSELSVGYCTLYGDMSGGLSVLADVPKMRVYALAEHINRERKIIPENTLLKPPSAELKPGQTDQDTLPPYEILDRIIELYVDQGWTSEAIREEISDPSIVNWVINAVKRNEYKRRQAAPGLKITTKAYGIGRRMPIAARFRE